MLGHDIIQRQADMHGALLQEARELQDAVALWTSAAYDEGLVRLRTLNASLSESSRNLEAIHKANDHTSGEG